MKEIKFFFKSPFFYFHGNCGKVCPIDSDFFLAYLVPLDVDVTGNITAKLCEEPETPGVLASNCLYFLSLAPLLSSEAVLVAGLCLLNDPCPCLPGLEPRFLVVSRTSLISSDDL